MLRQHTVGNMSGKTRWAPVRQILVHTPIILGTTLKEPYKSARTKTTFNTTYEGEDSSLSQYNPKPQAQPVFLISRRGKQLYFQAQMSGWVPKLQDDDEQIDAA